MMTFVWDVALTELTGGELQPDDDSWSSGVRAYQQDSLWKMLKRDYSWSDDGLCASAKAVT